MDTTKTDAIAEQLTMLNKTLLSLDTRLKTLEEQQQRRDDFFEEMSPVFKAVMHTATDKLQSMEEQGYFGFGREALRVMDRVVQSYDEQDVRALGDNIVRIMDTVRAFTQPQVLALANEASAVIERADELEPTGVFGMVRASRDEDVQRGMAVFLGLLRSLGHGVKAMRESGERKRVPAPSVAQRATGLGTPPPPRRPATPAPVPVPAPVAMSDTPVMVDGVAFDRNGYLTDASQWTAELAEAIAATQHIALAPRHWAAIEAARKDYAETGASPNIRRLTKVSDVSTRELYQLFPKAPGMTLARIAGLPKPVGCI